MHLSGVLRGPAFDPRVKALDPWLVADHLVADALNGPRTLLRPTVRIHGGDQILGAGEDEDVAVVVVSRQAFVGLPRDRRQLHTPAQAERRASGPGVVRQCQLGAETRAPRAGRKRNGQRPGAGDRIGRDLLPDPAHRPTALGQRDRRRGRDTGRSPGSASLRSGPRRVGTAGRQRALLLRPVRRPPTLAPRRHGLGPNPGAGWNGAPGQADPATVEGSRLCRTGRRGTVVAAEPPSRRPPHRIGTPEVRAV